MRSMVTQSDPKDQYPCLKQTTEGSVVLFIAQSCGILVHKSIGDPRQIGHYATNWAEMAFELFHGSVTISND